MRLSLRYDMRLPDDGSAAPEALYAAAIDQCAWADALGFDEVFIGEHHGAEDGYIPSPIVLFSAIASRTKSLRLHLSALLLPMHDPLRLAEDLAVLDLISGGRLSITVGVGYRPHEFAMFGVDFEKRMEVFLGTIEVLGKAWTGQPFSYRGMTVRVTPTPVQKPGPKIYMGGSGRASALRAARMGLEYRPGTADLYDVFLEECRALGRPQPEPLTHPRPNFLYVTENPERDWAIVGPHVLHMTNSYAQWATERKGGKTSWKPMESVEELKKNPIFQVVTPEECVAFAKSLGVGGELCFQPLAGGMDPETAWKSLRLFEKAVLPRLRAEGLL